MHGYAKNNLNYMKIIDKFINLLKLKRYSENTIETYKNASGERVTKTVNSKAATLHSKNFQNNPEKE